MAPTLLFINVAPHVLVDEDGQVHVMLVDVVGGAELRPEVEHLCERDNSPRSDLKTRARGSGGPAAADQQRLAATLIQNPMDFSHLLLAFAKSQRREASVLAN